MAHYDKNGDLVVLVPALTCDDCGIERSDVQQTTCPYAEEINDSIIQVILCSDCHQERAMEI